jgi:hypothetical protein
VICLVALGLSLGACETYGPDYGYNGYGYGGQGHHGQKCYEVRTTPFSRPYIECREIKRWKRDYAYRSDYGYGKPHYRYRDDDDDIYSYREPRRRWRDKEYYD